ncbi:uncharacterized protein LOC62_07G009089 [Vanrija pseudolonga]|uniref:Uncharacterized protein n=1 Tax=Vanrija pseudolonga TaxID=143232 RepID=A0AAF1BU45_9TREE|nr:hypothetical protein LOC62_07G009089 [Vanrija pseudolonga]
MTPLAVLLLATLTAALPVHQNTECCAAADDYSAQQVARGTEAGNPSKGKPWASSPWLGGGGGGTETTNPPSGYAGNPWLIRPNGTPYGAKGGGVDVGNPVPFGSKGKKPWGVRPANWPANFDGTGTHAGNTLIKGWPNTRRDDDGRYDGLDASETGDDGTETNKLVENGDTGNTGNMLVKGWPNSRRQLD